MRRLLFSLLVSLFSVNVYASVSLLGPSDEPQNVFKQANQQPSNSTAMPSHSIVVKGAQTNEVGLGERLLSRLNWPPYDPQSNLLVTDISAYQLRYPQLQQSIQYFHPEPLWYGYPQARNARDQLQWLLLELSLAGGPKQLSDWLRQINHVDNDSPQWEALYTDAYLGVMAFSQQLMRLDYAQSMALNDIATTPLHILIDEPWLARLSRSDLYQQLTGLRGELDIERLRYRQQILYWVNAQQQRQSADNIKRGQLIHAGGRDSRVPLVRQRLAEFDIANQFSDDLDQAELMDQATVNALQQFQAQHGLKADGIVGNDTLYWLNFKPIHRSKMLARNLLRKQLLQRFMLVSDQQRIMVNVPAYQMTYMNKGAEVFQSKVVVGRASRATPLLVSEISSVVINPYWNVPRTIVRRDIIPKLRRDPSYVEQQRFELFDYHGAAVQSEQIDWTLVKDTGAFPYRMRQRPGPGNALGAYKFHFDNQFAVYLHDTSSPELFSEQQRAFSSGCVRVEAAEILAATLLKQAGYSDQYKQHLIAKGEPKWVPLRQKVPVYLVYFTSWFDGSGGLHYRKDIYNFEASESALAS
ncbi:hypothetical protein AHAT_03400 [Agarivorans sp. Toyoura001]|nr:L,D-transpeptidase family protein [Agarivorans sp. Toyoura001]GDY24450.1 hypothetical protein AHAT_03400 [Agarivorans sp. Toyoura001]